MSKDVPVQNKNLNQMTTLVGAILLVAPDIANFLVEPPDFPGRLYGRHDLARVFGKHVDTIHRWQQVGWLSPIRKTSGRIAGYPTEQVAGVAARLFTRFRDSNFNELEAEKLGLAEVLAWVKTAVRTQQQAPENGKESPLVALAFAVFANSPEVAGPGVTPEDLAEHKLEACRQLLTRLYHPVARVLLFKAFRQAGLIAATATATASVKNAIPINHHEKFAKP